MTEQLLVVFRLLSLLFAAFAMEAQGFDLRVSKNKYFSG
jgi:hypothetical protein